MHKDKHIQAVDVFKASLASISSEQRLNEIRDSLRAYQRQRETGDLMDHPKYGLSLAYKALDERANMLGLIKYSFGYRKPLSNLNS